MIQIRIEYEPIKEQPIEPQCRILEVVSIVKVCLQSILHNVVIAPEVEVEVNLLANVAAEVKTPVEIVGIREIGFAVDERRDMRIAYSAIQVQVAFDRPDRETIGKKAARVHIPIQVHRHIQLCPTVDGYTFVYS